MPAPFNTDWMQRAFLKVEAALLNIIATHAAHNITEETLRAALFDGLWQIEPGRQPHVDREVRVPWHDAQCSFCNKQPGQGGRKRHDVAVHPHAGNPGIFCEVKWIKKNQHRDREIVSDILRLVLSRSCAKEGQAIRTYLLVGGESKPFGATLRRLQKAGINLRWSPAGNQTAPDAMPADTQLIMRSILHRANMGFAEFRDLMLFGPGHYRLPPDVWRHMKITLRARWLQTSSGRSWRMVLWEFSHWGVKQQRWSGNVLARKFRGLHQRRRRMRAA